MGARNWHIERAKHHKKASEYLETDFPDWCAVALYYSALQYIESALSGEPGLPKDERHPRKHTGNELGTRGRNQLVAALYPNISRQYRSLEEMSRRTRYDLFKLGPMTMPMLMREWKEVKAFCEGLNQGRQDIPTAQP
jgi:hypothetical protein